MNYRTPPRRFLVFWLLVMVPGVFGLACGSDRAASSAVANSRIVAGPGSKETPAPAVEHTTFEEAAPSLIARLTRTTRFIWPNDGPISSYFGPGHPLGIDIAMKPGSEIRASGSGTVEFAGGEACCEYGYYVVLGHSNGMTTLYAHLSNFTVKAGQEVGQGDVIGYSGLTGKTDGPHLHFEMGIGETLVDPLRFLPGAHDLPGEQESSACGAIASVLAPDSLVVLRFAPEILPGMSLKSATLLPDPYGTNLEVHIDRAHAALTVSFEEPAPKVAAGGVIERTLILQFANQDHETELDCRFVTPLNVTLANPPTLREQLKRLPTPTPVRNRPVSTPTATPTPKTLYSVLTPPRPTATPTQPAAVTRNSAPGSDTKPSSGVSTPRPTPKHFGP